MAHCFFGEDGCDGSNGCGCSCPGCASSNTYVQRSVELAKTEERAVIVTWIREMWDGTFDDGQKALTNRIADLIEQGEHRR